MIKKNIIFTKNQLKGLEENVTVYYKGKPFNQPVRVEEKTKISLTFKKQYFEDVTKEICVDDGNIGEIEWKYRVKKEMFDVVDEKNGSIIDFDIRLDKCYELPYDLKESELNKNHSISIVADGFITEDVEFKPKPDKYHIKLKRKPREYQIRLRNNHYAHIDYKPDEEEIAKEKLGISAILGYQIIKREDDGKYYFDPDEKLKKLYERPSTLKKILRILLPIVILLVAFVAGIICGKYLPGMRNSSQSIPSTEMTKGKVQDEPNFTKTNDNEIGMANEYLLKNKWIKEEMEQIEPLKGVWDALNTYDYDKIKSVDSIYHFDAPNWKDIINAIEEKAYKRKKGCTPICNNGDTQLTIVDKNNRANSYLYRINSAVGDSVGGKGQIKQGQMTATSPQTTGIVKKTTIQVNGGQNNNLDDN